MNTYKFLNITLQKNGKYLITFNFPYHKIPLTSLDYTTIFINALKNNGFDDLNYGRQVFNDLTSKRFSAASMYILRIFSTFTSSSMRYFNTYFKAYLMQLYNFDAKDGLALAKKNFSEQTFSELTQMADEAAKFFITELRTSTSDINKASLRNLKNSGFYYNANNLFHQKYFGNIINKMSKDIEEDIQLVSQYIRDTANADKIITSEEQKVIDAMNRIAKKQSIKPKPSSPFGWIFGSVGISVIIFVIIYFIIKKKKK